MSMKRTCYFWAALLVLGAFLPLSARADRNIVRLRTNFGDIIIELYPDDAPVTVANFLRYVNRGFYDGLIFHRVMDQFMIQAGAYDADLYTFLGGDPDLSDPNWVHNPLFYHEPNDPIINESDNGLKNLAGAISMARTGDLNSATSQFFINHVNNSSLDATSGNNGYTVFGGVIDGFDIVDDIAQAPTQYVNESLGDLPFDAVIIESVAEIRAFDANSVDLRDVAFLHAEAGIFRIFMGQGAFAGINYTHTFSAETFLNIECLKWQQRAEEGAGVEDFSMLLARDKAGGLWIFKYVINEGQADEEIIIEAATLFEGVSFSEFAEENIYFRLITGEFNPDNLADPNNMVTVGQGAEATTWKIVGTDVKLDTFDEELILVKTFIGDEQEPNNVDWLYYAESTGLVFDLLDGGADPQGDGRHLAPMRFDGLSDDLSGVAYLHVPAGGPAVRTYVGRGVFDDINYTHTFTPSAEPFSGVNYMIWTQSGVETADIDSFTMHLVRDVTDSLWVFKYEVNEATQFEAERIVEAAPLSEFNDVMYFRLLSGLFDPNYLGDPCNVITAGDETQQIMSFSDSADHIPHYKGELLRVEKWEGVSDPNNEVFLYHESRGLILNQRGGTTGAAGDGWHLAFYGAEFETNSNDFSAAPFINAAHNTVRKYFGRGIYEGLSYRYEYTPRLHIDINCLKWERTFDSDPGLDAFYMYLGRDNMGVIWVFRYFINGKESFKADTIFDAKPMTDFDDDMFFRLISGNYDPNYLDSSRNRFSSEEEGMVKDHVIHNLQAQLDYLPHLNQELVLEKITPQESDPNITWRYFDESAGLVLELTGTTENPADPNFYDPNDTTLPPINPNGWQLGWYGRVEPTFAGDSDDFVDAPFVNASDEDIRVYRGQGEFAGSSYRVLFSSEEVFGVDCLRIDETEIIEWLRPSRSYLLAKDTIDKVWLFRAESNGFTVFEAGAIEEIVPLELYPDMYLRLISGDFEEGTAIITGAGSERQTEQVISTDESLENYEEFDEELVLVQWLLGENNDDVTWTYWHDSTGSVLELWPDSSEPNSFDPDLIDTAGGGWHLAEPNRMEDLIISLKAGNTRTPASDYFKITGRIPQAEAEDFEDTELLLSVGSWQMALDTETPEFKRIGAKPLFMYKGSPDGAASVVLVIDLRKNNKFTMVAKKVDLSGLEEPIRAVLVSGDYYGAGQADIKRDKKVPMQFFKGQADTLRFTKFRLVFNDGPNAYYSYNLTISGQIATEIFPLDLSGKEVTISWGNKSFTVPEGDNGLRRVRNTERFVYKNSDNELRSAEFNLNQCTYQIVIKRTNLSRPPQNFTIKFETEEGLFFEQTVLVF